MSNLATIRSYDLINLCCLLKALARDLTRAQDSTYLLVVMTVNEAQDARE